MAFISKKAGKSYESGNFLVNPEEAVRVTKNFKQGDSTNLTIKDGENNTKYVPAGSIYKEGEGTAVGLVYEDVDITNGDAAGSVVIEGIVYKNKLETEAQEAAAEIDGITVIEKGSEVTRPDFTKGGV